MAETEDSLCLQMMLSVKPLRKIKHECKFRIHCDLIFAKKNCYVNQCKKEKLSPSSISPNNVT